MSTLLLLFCLACFGVGIFALVLVFGRNVAVNMRFYRRQFSANAEVELADMFIFASGQQLFVLNLMLLVIIPLLLHALFHIMVITAGGALVSLFVPRMLFKMLRRKRMRKFEEQLPDAFMLLSSSLQSGASLNMALENLVQQSPPPLSQEFGLLMKKVRLGVSLEDALVKMEQRMPLPSFVMASSAVRISREVGGNLVETITGMATTLRRKKIMEGKIDSLTAQGRAQGLFMAMLPIFLAGILSVIEPEAMSQLYTTRMGLMVLAGMVVMEILGFTFIKKITQIDA
jgi:tight adherence protein B